MQSLIDISTAFSGAGNAAMRRQFKLRSGPYCGRKLVIYHADAHTIKYSYADAPYREWSAPQLVTDNSADYPCSGWMDSDGSVYLVYTKQAPLNLVFRKLLFTSGAWSVGNEVVVHGDKDNFYPSIFKDSTSRLHVCWSCFDGTTGQQTLRYKRSTSDGNTWGGGTADPGTALTDGSSSCFSQIVYAAPTAYCFYTDAGNRLAVRRLLDGAASWEGEFELLGGVLLGDRISAAIATAGGLIGIAFEAAYKLCFQEFDGANWSAAFQIASLPATAPLLLYNGAIPHVFYGVEIGAGQVELRYRYKNGSGFSAESILAPESARFAAVYLYDADGTPQFQGRTLEAASTVAADVLTNTSHALVAAANDAVYLGADEPFASVNIVLSTAGSGGAVVWEYFDGTEWKSFTPATGECHFDEVTKLLRLWPDTAHVPLDWQRARVESSTKFWVRARVVTTFTTAPIGSQLTPCTATICLNN
jgi:hypothetical protein